MATSLADLCDALSNCRHLQLAVEVQTYKRLLHCKPGPMVVDGDSLHGPLKGPSIQAASSRGNSSVAHQWPDQYTAALSITVVPIPMYMQQGDASVTTAQGYRDTIAGNTSGVSVPR
jgi:hypothetical protein